MPYYPESELILNTTKKVYHLNLDGDVIADTVIVVGDQNRVPLISSYFSNIEFKTRHREFITHTGTFNGKRFTVLSTGIGTDNIDIVMNELDAAVNIDLEKREKKTQQRQLNIIRLGTSGALQEEIPVDSLVLSTFGLGLDGLLPYYKDWKNINENSISEAFIRHSQWPRHCPYPYCVAANSQLLGRFNEGFYQGITATASGFYGPQGRELRLKPSFENLTEILSSFRYKQLQITNFEMETSALYGLGKLLDHACLTICVIIANRKRNTFTRNYEQSERHLIETCLNHLSQ